MDEIGIRELKTHTSEIMRRVREEGARYTVTYRGKPVGVLIPVEENGDLPAEATPDPWEELEKLRDHMASLPKPEKSLTEVLTEMRR